MFRFMFYCVVCVFELVRQKDRKTERQKDRKTEDRKTERQKDRKTERQKDRKTERQLCALLVKKRFQHFLSAKKILSTFACFHD
jgi:hypothetical protein